MNTERARALLRAEGIDGMVATTLENNYYLSGVWFLGQEMFPRDAEAYVVATADRPDGGTIVSSIGEADLTLDASPTIADVRTFGTFFRDVIPDVELTEDEQRVRALTEMHESGRPPVDALADAIEDQGLADAVVAVDERGARRDLLSELAERCPNATLRPGAALLRRIRAVKTDAEVTRLVATLRATEAAFRATIDAFEEGVTERELKSVFERTVVENSARPGFCLLRFGRGLALGQVPSGDVRLAKGDTVFFDIGCDLAGYKSDIGRLVSFGEPTAGTMDLYAATKAGQQVAIDMMKPGAVAQDVFHAAVEAVRDGGIAGYQRQHVGHGIGIEYYDVPVLAPGADTVLEAGMVFEVETPYYRLGVGGSFIEDTVLVTDDGPQILTELDRELMVVDHT